MDARELTTAPIPFATANPYTCRHCGKSFFGRKRKFCSPDCRTAGQKKYYKATKFFPVETNHKKSSYKCKQCGNIFDGRARGYCGKDCAAEAKIQRDRKRKAAKRISKKPFTPRRNPTPIINGMRVCLDCGTNQPLANYKTKEDPRCRSGFAVYSICMVCENISERIRRQQNKKSKKDGVAKLIRAAIRRNGTSRQVESLCGYSIAELKAHIEQQFTKRMTWDQFMSGEIHIDHIVPQRTFNLQDDNEWRACWALTNLRPMWAKDNLSKGGKILYLI